MRWEDLAAEPCSVARTVAVIGDRWTMLILRDCFSGVRRFDDFQNRLGISRTIVADRLSLLVREGVLKRTPYQDRPTRHEYRLTEKGRDLHPVLMAMFRWGDKHYADPAGPPLIFRHRVCGHDFRPVVSCSECSQALDPRDVDVRPGPGYRGEPRS